MPNLKELVTDLPTDFSFEHAVFTAIPWTEVVIKNISLIRCIMTIKTVRDAGEALKALQSSEYDKFVSGNKYLTAPTFQVFIEKLAKLPDASEATPLQTWANLLNHLKKDSIFLKEDFLYENAWNQLLARVSPLVITAHKESKEFGLSTSVKFFSAGFETEILDSFTQKINTCSELEEAWKIGGWIKEHFAPHAGTKEVAQLAYDLCEKLVAEQLTKDGLTFDDYKKLYAYGAVYEARRPISKESVAAITNVVKKFFDQQVASETPWVEIQKMPVALNLGQTFLYYEREIKEVSLEKLKLLLVSYNSLTKSPQVDRLTFLNLLRQQEIIKEEIVGITDIQKLLELQRAIPNDLKYLNAELLEKAQVLLGT